MSAYIPNINLSPDCEDIVDILSEISWDTLQDYKHDNHIYRTYVNQAVSRGGENDFYDDYFEKLCILVDAGKAWDREREIRKICEALVTTESAIMFAENDDFYNDLTDAERRDVERNYDKADEIEQVIANYERRGSRHAQSTRRDDRRDRSRSRGRDNSRARVRDDYDDRSERRGRDRGRDRGRQNTRGRDVYEDSRDYHIDTRAASSGAQRGRSRNNNNRRRDTRGGLQTGAAMETIIADTGIQVERVQDNRRSNPQRSPERQVRQERVRESTQPVRQEPQEQKLTMDFRGKKFDAVAANFSNWRQYQKPKPLPIFAPGTVGYLVLDNQGKVIGSAVEPDIEDNDVDMNKHDASKFFKAWGIKNREADRKKTLRLVGNAQKASHLKELEDELRNKYGEPEEVVEPTTIDSSNLVTVNLISTLEPNEDYVTTGHTLLKQELVSLNEDYEVLQHFDASNQIINYNLVSFANWTLKERAATIARGLKDARNYNAILTILEALSEEIPSSVLFEIDQIATRFINRLLRYRFVGEGNPWNIDSFMSDIGELIVALRNERGVSDEFAETAQELVGTVLSPLTNEDADVRALTGLSEGELEVKFGENVNVTLLPIDSDELAIYLTGDSGIVSPESWPSFHTLLKVVAQSAPKGTSVYRLVTRDNRELNVIRGNRYDSEFIIYR